MVVKKKCVKYTEAECRDLSQGRLASGETVQTLARSMFDDSFAVFTMSGKLVVWGSNPNNFLLVDGAPNPVGTPSLSHLLD